jgi:hypothetical protein
VLSSLKSQLIAAFIKIAIETMTTTNLVIRLVTFGLHNFKGIVICGCTKVNNNILVLYLQLMVIDEF